MERPGRAVLKPALAAENGRQAGGSGHVTGGPALPQVGEQESRTGALTDSIDLTRRLPVPNVSHRFPQVSRVTKLLQFNGSKLRPILAPTVEDHREVTVT